MKKHYASVVMMLAGLAACGGAYATSPSTTTGPATNPTAFPRAGARVVVKLASSPFGQILVDEAGNTLYAFTKDTEAKPTCAGACAQAWPPATVSAAWSIANGLDAGLFRAVTSAGQMQLIAGNFPLYRFAGDARPGDFNGQGISGVWFVVDARANPIHGDGAPPATTVAPATTVPPATTAPPATTVAPKPVSTTVSVVDNKLGQILAGPDGRTLYGFTQDANGTSTCIGACAQAWPPVIVDASLDLNTLPNSQLFSLVDRPDGTKQLKAGKWPLYNFAGDSGPGDTNGQGSGGSWFVIGQDAKLVKQF